MVADVANWAHVLEYAQEHSRSRCTDARTRASKTPDATRDPQKGVAFGGPAPCPCYRCEGHPRLRADNYYCHLPTGGNPQSTADYGYSSTKRASYTTARALPVSSRRASQDGCAPPLSPSQCTVVESDPLRSTHHHTHQFFVQKLPTPQGVVSESVRACSLPHVYRRVARLSRRMEAWVLASSPPPAE